jgi:hypothetical protein
LSSYEGFKTKTIAYICAITDHCANILVLINGKWEHVLRCFEIEILGECLNEELTATLINNPISKTLHYCFGKKTRFETFYDRQLV